LYHEFGHGLHSLLSRTSFQHLSGTRAAMDFVETPSHLFESFARDPVFMSRMLARHYITGMPMSERRARHLALSHSDFRGIEIQTQIVHSKFDQALFGHTPCSPSLGGCSSTEMFQRLHEEAGVSYANGTHWHTKFGHLVTYGAGYYGYLFAQTFAADIWMSVLASCMTTSPDAVRNGGTKIWKEMLLHGGAKDPKEMLHAVLGRELSVDPFFRL
jgi:intermediate peptidase